MGDLMAKCDWHDGTLSIVLPEDPERIAVRMFDSRLAPARLYVPKVESTARRVIVTDGDTDCATGHCECGACGGAIDCWDRFCRHCGARMEDA